MISCICRYKFHGNKRKVTNSWMDNINFNRWTVKSTVWQHITKTNENVQKLHLLMHWYGCALLWSWKIIIILLVGWNSIMAYLKQHFTIPIWHSHFHRCVHNNLKSIGNYIFNAKFIFRIMILRCFWKSD